MRWVRLSFLALAGLLVFTFGADWLLFKMEGSPTSKFTVSHFVSAPLKNNKEEIDYTGSEEVPCSITLFPQGGMTPCWWLREHLNEVTRY
ncbi:hypothetical protein DYQ86_19635 [Acidobacteria bacterium AB60]|nr:hypothetical protein DYQ86_19635 [Acidobacteria bacterium AB60]